MSCLHHKKANSTMDHQVMVIGNGLLQMLQEGVIPNMTNDQNITLHCLKK